jgi:hypothetical protein
MKNLKIILLSALLSSFFGCNKDLTETEELIDLQTNKTVLTQGDEDNLITSRTPEVRKVPFKYDFEAIANLDPDYTISCVVPFPPFELEFFKKGWIKGKGTHLGKIDMEASPWIITNCQFMPTGQFHFELLATLTGANGDSFDYAGDFYIDPALNFTGNFYYIAGTGTGKFTKATGGIVDATGLCTIDLTLDPIPVYASFTGEGYIEYSK